MILFFADIFPRHRMFQKHPMSFLGKAGAVCSRCISLNKGTSRHRMSDRHPMSNQNEFRLGKRNRFWDYNISWGQKIISPPVPSCSTLYPVFCRGERTGRPYKIPRHRMFQKHPMSFLGKAGAVCSRCISSNKGIPRHRMSARHPMSNQNEFGFGNEIGFGIIISCVD